MLKEYKMRKQVNIIWKKSVEDYKKELKKELDIKAETKKEKERQEEIEKNFFLKHFEKLLFASMALALILGLLYGILGIVSVIGYLLFSSVAIILGFIQKKRIDNESERYKAFKDIRKKVWKKVIEQNAKEQEYSYNRYVCRLIKYHRPLLLQRVFAAVVSISLTCLWVILSLPMGNVGIIISCLINVVASAAMNKAVDTCYEDYYFESFMNDAFIEE